jgi:hypothetical protein
MWLLAVRPVGIVPKRLVEGFRPQYSGGRRSVRACWLPHSRPDRTYRRTRPDSKGGEEVEGRS